MHYNIDRTKKGDRKVADTNEDGSRTCTDSSINLKEVSPKKELASHSPKLKTNLIK